MTFQQASWWLWLASLYRAAGQLHKARSIYRCAENGLQLRGDLARQGPIEATQEPP